jgi:3',5'-cyclic AMP phosphodiesterase CpdA
MFRLAHISDVHLGPLPDVTYRDLASKRMVGYVNWQRNRRRHHHDGIVDAIVADLKVQAPNHLAVTGDLVNLALDGEIALARLWLETLGEPADVSVVPGNHDAYVPGAFDKACHAWAPWMHGDGVHGAISSTSFPYLRVRQGVALIGVSTARATAPFMASGFFREGQAERLGRVLDETGKRGLFRAIMIHHPPVRGAVGQHKRLFGIGKFQKLVRRHGAELVLHGHSHLPTLHWIDGRDGAVPVVGVAAAGQAPGGHKPAAQFNLLDISGQSGDWNVRLTRRGLSGPSMPSAEIGTFDLSAAVPRSAALVRE